MASRAHVIHDYSYGRRSERPRREVWYREEDPVVLPRSSIWSSSGGLILAALAVGGLIAGGLYAGAHRPTVEPVMAVTPTPPLETPDFQLDPEIERARVTNLLSGPAYAVPEKGEAAAEPEEEDTNSAGASSPRAVVAGKQHTNVDDGAPRARDASPGSSKAPATSADGLDALPHAPYPNPTITPPDGVAPPDTPPEAPTPVLGPENNQAPRDDSATAPESKQLEENPYR